MRRRGVAAALGALALLSGCSTGSGAVEVNNGGQFRYVAGTPAGEVIAAADRQGAPRFTGTLLDGSPFRSTSLDGDVAVLNFWGSWCPPCRVETPQFQQVYSEVADQGVQFLGIDLKDQEQFARAFLADNGITYPSLSDPRGEVGLAFRGYPANAIPSTIVLDRQGRVAAVYTSAVEPDDLRGTLDRLIGEGA